MIASYPGIAPSSEPATESFSSPDGATLVAAPRPVILIVDDEPVVRAVLAAALHQYGFAVQLASCGREALEFYREHGRDIALVLLDRRMPGLDGLQTLAALRGLDPKVRCCLMSGAHDDHVCAELLLLGVAWVFRKPFILAQVAQTLRRLLVNAEPEPASGM